MGLAYATVLTQQEMEDDNIPQKLLACRHTNFFLPWKCVEKRNALIRCEEYE